MAPSSKRRKTSTIEEISFDSAARQDYLSGFHKRKQQRIRHAKEFAAKKERELKIEQRRQLREQRKKDLEKHVETVEKMLKEAEDIAPLGESLEADSSASELQELEIVGSGEGNHLETPRRQDEYIDEEKLTTVTIKPMDETESEEDSGENTDESESEKTRKVPQSERDSAGGNSKKRVWTKEKPNRDRPKKKRKKFRYESKSDRKITRAHERNNSAAARARRRNKAKQNE